MKLLSGNSGRTPDFRYFISTFTIDYFIVPVFSGIYGFCFFFIILIAVKVVLNAAGNSVPMSPAALESADFRNRIYFEIWTKSDKESGINFISD